MRKNLVIRSSVRRIPCWCNWNIHKRKWNISSPVCVLRDYRKKEFLTRDTNVENAFSLSFPAPGWWQRRTHSLNKYSTWNISPWLDWQTVISLGGRRESTKARIRKRPKRGSTRAFLKRPFPCSPTTFIRRLHAGQFEWCRLFFDWP